MGHSIGDGIVALAIASIFLGYFYWKYRGKQQRLEVIHKERLVAMDKGILEELADGFDERFEIAQVVF
jgi:hypothetical protein